jgi:hypothetical protein
MPTSDDFCYLSHNYPYEEVASLAMAPHLQFCPQASMHSNNKNFLAKFVKRMCFGVQPQTKLVNTPFQGYETNIKTTQS